MGITMKKSVKKFIAALLCAVMLASPLTVSAKASYSARTVHPFVFVHGLCGWGYNDGAYDIFPYWGLTTGNVFKTLEKQGYECYAASVGPLSSAWDRACELYAQLTGTTVDYGASHSAAHNHDRYGRTYAEPLVKEWDEEHPINLVGHSFGGATCRLFIQLLIDGDPAEREASKDGDLSPLFKGGQKGLVYSLTTLAAPHNGTSLTEINDNLTQLMVDFFICAANVVGNSAINKLYDPQLEHFGLTTPPDMDVRNKIDLSMSVAMAHCDDNAFGDLSVDGAARLNERLTVQPDIYYYSYVGSKTHVNEKTGNYVPDLLMNPMFMPFATMMGKIDGKKTDNGYKIGKEWRENDGLVPVISARAPFNEKSQTYNPLRKTQPGVWNIMPVERLDHLQFVGGLINVDFVTLRVFYTKMAWTVTRSGKGV